MIQEYIAIFFIYSILGWIMEVCFSFYIDKKYTNRGCLIGPYCPIYGFGVGLLTIVLSKYNFNLFILFIITFLLCSILEYLTGFILEKIFKLRWWDYSRYKYNINGRICLETMIPFSILGTVIIKYINPLIFNLLDKIPKDTLLIIDIILLIIIFIDIIFSIFFTIKTKNDKKISGRDATKEIKDNAYKMVVDKVKKKN